MSASDHSRQVGWRSIPGFPRYRVDEEGSVFSDWGKIGEGWQKMATPPDKDGYPKVLLYQGGMKRHVRVHTLVLECFVGPRPANMESCHIDGNVANPRLDNLRWDTHGENIADRAFHGTTARGDRSGKSKLKDADIPIIVEMLRSGLSYQLIAERFNVTRSTIFSIASKKTWRHVAREDFNITKSVELFPKLNNFKKRIRSGTVIEAIEYGSDVSEMRTVTKAGASCFWWESDSGMRSQTKWPKAAQCRVDNPNTITIVRDSGRQSLTISIVADGDGPAHEPISRRKCRC